MARDTFSFSLLFLLCFPPFSFASNSESVANDQASLLALKSSITLDFSSRHLLSNWTEETSVCSWIGGQCSTVQTRVVALNISFLGLEGTIPPQIGNLSFLHSIDISNNKFRGEIPREFSKLTKLRYIGFDVNNINGEIPGWFGSLPDLRYLNLGNNSFSGNIPSSLFHSTKLELLRLYSNQLSGYLPEEVGNLRSLKVLGLQANRLQGSFPLPIFNLSSLRILSLANNRFSGPLPMDICSKLPNLTTLQLSKNQFSGQIQSRLSNCSKFELISLSSNEFTGPIPREIGNLTKLVVLDLGYNQFQGEIPTEIGNLQSVFELRLSTNFLSGLVPPGLFNISALVRISLLGNKLTGSLPLNIGQQIPNLEQLALSDNKLSGVIPNSISNLTSLTDLSLSQNQFTGSIPTSLGSLKFLRNFLVSWNFLTIDASPDFDFLASLTNSRSLKRIDLSLNPLNIQLLPSIGNFSNSLGEFYAISCGIKGQIPSEIENLGGLFGLQLGYNNLTGLLPPEIEKLSNLQGIGFEGNQITGFIPDFLCNLSQLSVLYLGKNQFFGQVPKCFGNMTSLREISLHNNRLNSTIPNEFRNLRDLLLLDVHSNFLSGNISPVAGLKKALSIDLSENNFSGSIPESIGDLASLTNLSLAYNQLQGTNPREFGGLKSLESLDLSSNNLTGEIPITLESISNLKKFNVSFNHLRGRIPTNGSFSNFTQESFMFNDALCGGAPSLHFLSCTEGSPRKGSRRKILQIVAYILIPVVALVILISGIFVFMNIRKQKKKSGIHAAVDISSAAMHERFSFYDIQRATNDFSESNLLGTGGFGQVYKGVFKDGAVLAIKVFKPEIEVASRSFHTECQIVSSIRHRNLVKVISSCANQDFKALVLDFMPKGSLEQWLYSHNHFLDLLQRLNIMADVASALDYLHHGYTSPIVHCDLKPSNVLLDEQMTGHVSDFGISKLLGEDERLVQTRTLATIGYTAPEYGSQGLVSTSCDIYSFGILLMEIFSRKRPTDDIFGEGRGLKEMVMDGLQSSATNFIDQNLLSSKDKISELSVKCILSTMQLALRCTVNSPENRINANKVLNELQKSKQLFVFSSERISK